MSRRFAAIGVLMVLSVLPASADEHTPNKVQKVMFLGAKHVKEEILRRVTGVRPGTSLTPKRNREGCQRILDKYEEIGRPFASCILVQGGEPSDTEVIYQITEGPKVRVRDIQFTGNTFISGARLTKRMKSSPTWFHAIGGVYNSRMAEEDVEELTKYFKSFGYQDAKVSLERQRSEDGGAVTLIFHIHEGPRYTVKDIPQVINGQSIPQEQLEAMLRTKSGEHLDENKIQADEAAIRNYYGYTGRTVQVQHNYLWSQDTPGVVQVQYQIEEHPQARIGQKARVGQIFLSGNKRISDQSILVHVPLFPGKILSYPELQQAEKSLAELGLFVVDPATGVHPTITVLDRDDSAFKDILITVKEKKARDEPK